MTKLTYKDLYPFQKKIYDRFKDSDNAALLCDMGVGKTPMCISILRYRYSTIGDVAPTVIFCPVIVLQNWKKELTTWTNIAPSNIGIVKGTAKKRLKIIEDKKHRIIIVNYEALRSEAVMNALLKRKFKVAICDESQRIKSHTSKTYKSVKKIGLGADLFRAILSGTPITNKITDIWSQFMFLDRGATFGKGITTFRAKYMINDNQDWQDSGKKTAFPSWRLNPSMTDEFNKRINDVSARITTEEAVDLPALVTTKIDVELSPEQSKHYKEVSQDLVTWIDGKEDTPLVAQNILTKLLRLNEISSGFMKLYDNSIHSFKTNPRLDACMSLIEECAPHKVIIFCIYSQNYKDLRQELDKRKISYAEITGEVSTDVKLKTAELFNNPKGGPRVCIANTRAAGLGINLVGARYKIYYSRNFSLEDHLQSQKRNNRAGAIEHHDTIYDYHLVTPDTIDESIYNALAEKKEFARSLLDIEFARRLLDIKAILT